MSALTLEDIRRDVAALLDEPPSTVGNDDDLIGLGVDSLGVMKLAAQWYGRGVKVRFAELLEWRTVGEWWRLLSSRVESSAADRGVRIDDRSLFDLSTMQRAYWFGSAEGQPLGACCHFYFEFDGRGVDAARLERAVRLVLRRHAMLRVCIDADGRQRILDESPWPRLRVVDLSSSSAVEVEARLERVRTRESERRLDASRSEVFDVALTRLPGGATRTHVNIAMLAADAMSFRILIDELARAYATPDADLAPLEYSYAQYLADHAGANAAARARAEAYWKDRVAALPSGPDLPLATAPERLTRPRATRREHWLPEASLTWLSQNAQRHGLTLSLALATAYADVIAEWASESRFVINVPLFDREPLHPDVFLLVGDFTTSVLLEVDAAEGGTFAERAARLQSRFRADAANAAYSGVDLLRDRARLLGGAPEPVPVVFTSAMSMGDLFSANVYRSFGDVAWMISQTAQVWLDHQVTEIAGRLLLNWDAVEGLFPDGMLDRMFEAYVARVTWLARPNADWAAAPPASFEAPPVPAIEPADVAPRRLHDGLLRWAAEHPERTALIDADDEVVTYGALASRARRIAGGLLERGLRPGDRIGVSIPRGPDQVAAVVGVLFAGGTFVPIGADQPAARRMRMEEIAGVRWTMTEVVDADEAAPHAAPPAASAYVLFTSGSTGTPKGVSVSHRAAMNTIDAINRRFEVGPDDRLIGVSAFDFDLWIYDVFGALSAGASLVLVDDAERRDASAWARRVTEASVTVWQSAPQLFEMLLDELRACAAPVSLRLVLLGGDWIAPSLYDRLRHVAPSCRMIGLGGTTETAIHSTCFEVDETCARWPAVPYGAPLHNVRCRVVDELGRDRPDHATGELWIGGAGVADGYVGDPGRSGERFVEVGGIRWYRTGDFARRWPDGTLELLGRRDDQLKVRGHRVELGEVEAAATRHAGVARAAAFVSRSPSDRIGLAFVRADGADGVDVAPDALLELLRAELPPAMVPERVLVLDALPLTRNGKVDRRRLVELAAGATKGAAFDAPEGPIERTVAEVWAALLSRTLVGRSDSFFELGGDSLLATKMSARLATRGFGGGLLRRLFAAPRLADFCAGLTPGDPAPQRAPLVIDRAARHEPFEPTEAQVAYWIGRNPAFTLGGVGSHWYWEFDGTDVDLGKLERGLRRLIRRHDMLRVVFDGEGRQRILPEVDDFVLRVERAAHGADRAALSAFRERMSSRVFDASIWPLFDVQALQYGDGRTRVGFGFDYIAIDALSIAILCAELSALYDDEHAALLPLELSFRDYVVGTGPDAAELEAATRYWTSCLDELPDAPQLPLARDPATVVEPRFTRRETRLMRDDWGRIVERAKEAGITPSSVLATVYAEVLSTWSTEASITLNFTLFDRREVHPDVGRILGDFTSLMLVPYTSGADAEAGWISRMRAMQESVWAGLEHRAVSATWVMRELAKRRRSDRVLMPVVFTSTLGVADDLVTLSMPFGTYAGGLSQTPQVWIDNQVVEDRGALLANWDAVDDLFLPGVLDEMFAAYERLLRWLAAPDSRWSGPPPAALPEAQRARRAAVNATEADQTELRLGRAFFDHASGTPDALAVGWGDGGRLTYGALADRALRVGAALRARGVERGDTVAVRLPRGPDQITAVLGVIAAGAAYVPIGRDQPPVRAARMLDTARASVVIDDLVELTTRAPLAAPVDVEPDDLAYVIFTSGSSGAPRGVEVSHRAAANTVEDVVTRWRLTREDRVLAVSALDFDLSVFDIFGLLGCGGAVITTDDAEWRDARRWHRLIERFGVSVWNSVPALAEMLVDAASDARSVSSLRVALLSGDWIETTLPSRLRALAPGLSVVGLGGATEASIWANAYEIGDVPAHWRSIPYGRPLRNQRYRVVGSRGEDRPDWVRGELWIGGRGVARGYRGDPDQTHRAFVEYDGERWYRTGDDGCYWPDGMLEFLGRRDGQIKLRGHRIELREIEHALTESRAVAQAVAVVVDEPRRIVAFVTASGGDVLLDDLRSDMVARLPSAMVPSEVRVVDSIPLTANGKVDRATLRAQWVAAPRAREAPVGPLERTLAEMWVELLVAASVGRNETFFEAGGNSLLAVRLLAGICRRYGVEVTLRAFFERPTIAKLAEQLVAADPSIADETMEEGLL